MQNQPTIMLLLGHRARVGKDTLAEMLVFHDIFYRLAFADKLKETVQDLYNFSRDQMYGTSKDIMDERYPNHRDPVNIEEFSIPSVENFDGNAVSLKHTNFAIPNPDYLPFLTPRRILQIFGHDQRSIYPNIWASYVTAQAERLERDGGWKRFVVSDFRFPNEYEAAKAWEKKDKEGRKVLTVRIDRASNDQTTAISGAADISETALDEFDGWDHVLVNDGTKEDLHAKCVELLS